MCGSKWLYINCDASNNVVIVNLGKLGLSGTISPGFANLTKLKSLFLSDNNLTGSILDSLTSLAQLRVLDVSNNILSGVIPKFPEIDFELNTSGNPFIGKIIDDGGGKATPGSSPGSKSPSGSSSPKKSSTSAGMISGIVDAIGVFIIVVLYVSYKGYTRR